MRKTFQAAFATLIVALAAAIVATTTVGCNAHAWSDESTTGDFSRGFLAGQAAGVAAIESISFTPTEGLVGASTSVTVKGGSFAKGAELRVEDPAVPNVFVSIAEAAVGVADDGKSLSFSVPAQGKAGKLKLKLRSVPSGDFKDLGDFTVKNTPGVGPSVASITTSSGGKGTLTTAKGSAFDTVLANNTVKVDTREAKVTAVNSVGTELTFEVPDGVSTGAPVDITFEVKDRTGVATLAKSFTFLPATTTVTVTNTVSVPLKVGLVASVTIAVVSTNQNTISVVFSAVRPDGASIAKLAANDGQVNGKITRIFSNTGTTFNALTSTVVKTFSTATVNGTELVSTSLVIGAGSFTIELVGETSTGIKVGLNSTTILVTEPGTYVVTLT